MTTAWIFNTHYMCMTINKCTEAFGVVRWTYCGYLSDRWADEVVQVHVRDVRNAGGGSQVMHAGIDGICWWGFAVFAWDVHHASAANLCMLGLMGWADEVVQVFVQDVRHAGAAKLCMLGLMGWADEVVQVFVQDIRLAGVAKYCLLGLMLLYCWSLQSTVLCCCNVNIVSLDSDLEGSMSVLPMHKVLTTQWGNY